MNKEILDSMTDSDNCITEFSKACVTMVNSKFILHSQRIADILKSIAASKRLYALFTSVSEDFDYVTELTRASATGEFRLPQNKVVAVALVFRVLYEIDKGLPLLEFLNDYFEADDANEKYARFCLEAISPFEVYTRELYSELQFSKMSHGAIEVERALDLHKQIIAAIAAESSSPNPDFALVSDGLSSAIFSDSLTQLKRSYTAFKYAVKSVTSSHEVNTLLSELASALKVA